MSQCSSCRAEIIWATTTVGKRIPLDPMPSLAGTLVVLEDRPGFVVRVKEALLERHLAGYTSHFATCPNADQHRRR